jgi:ornithine decarboxylase
MITRKLRGWVRRYLPMELAGTAAALSAALVVSALDGGPVQAALAGSVAEAVGFYGLGAVQVARGHRGTRHVLGRTVRDLAVEFGPAEVLDSLLLRPGLMYLAARTIGDLTAGVLVGKLVADVVFYLIAIAGYELRQRLFPTPPVEVATAATADPAVEVATTPYLHIGLDEVQRRYRELAAALPGINLHYAMKCNPAPPVLRRLHACGCGFEIASYSELVSLVGIGVDPGDVLFSNPVKSPDDIARAFRAGVRRFAFDSIAELAKLAAHAPGSQVYVRLAAPPLASEVASEGKFGVDPEQAEELLRRADRAGLEAFGIAFHVGSQMLDPVAWEVAIERAAEVLRALDRDGLRLRMLDIGGGFPARYDQPVPDFVEFGESVTKALDRYLPYDLDVVAEPGRALVAEAGVFVTTVIGVAERFGARWVHLDVGAFNGMMEALETRNELRYPMTDSRCFPVVRPVHVTGPSCDSQDTILFDVPLSEDLAVGDQVFIHAAGAYTTSYASRFNGFGIPPVLCRNGSFDPHSTLSKRSGSAAGPCTMPVS